MESKRSYKETCYEHLVTPLVEYASSIWDPWTKENISKIEAVQRRSARFVCSDYSRYSSVKSMMEDLKWPSLEERRARNKVTLMYRIVRQQIAIDREIMTKSSASNNRGHSWKFHLPYARTQAYKFSFFPSTIRLWNLLLAEAVDSPTIDAFRNRISKIKVKVKSITHRF